MTDQQRRLGAVVTRMLVATLLAAGTFALPAPAVEANHPVFVEGNCRDGDASGSTTVTPNTCGDYDGDGRIGEAEDTDGDDRVFGTITAALGPGTEAAAGTGANQNGRVVIVASGRFNEVVTITAANGNVTLEAAPGVEANIEAVVQGQPNTGPLQSAPGIIVNAPPTRYVTIRNIISRNWTDGIQVRGGSRVTIDECRIENNVAYGVRVIENARVAITGTEINGSGFRQGMNVDNTPRPGGGIIFTDRTIGLVSNTTITGSIAAGLTVEGQARVNAFQVVTFDNNPNLRGITFTSNSVDGPSTQERDDLTPIGP